MEHEEYIKVRCPKCNKFLCEGKKGSKIRIKCTRCDLIWNIGPIDRLNIPIDLATGPRETK